MSKKITWIRPVYLYLMSMIGLVILIIGGITILQLLLKIFIFTNADTDRWSRTMPPELYLETSRSAQEVRELRDCSNQCDFTEEEQKQITAWLADYESWKESEGELAKIDQRRVNRERQASTSLGMILVGLPLWLYHWSVIKRDKKRDKEELKSEQT
ncbi:hypothetical protein KKF32_00795 [Patescibacteria group bacterium]|nr:hypothetical protein [Patescibacteria group bacterium]